MGAMVYMHETAHATISEYHGCINGSITWVAVSPYFMCYQYHEDVTYELHAQEYLLHSINEIVSYNLECLFALIYGLGTIVLVRKQE
jgi:hypothetical protein